MFPCLLLTCLLSQSHILQLHPEMTCTILHYSFSSHDLLCLILLYSCTNAIHWSLAMTCGKLIPSYLNNFSSCSYLSILLANLFLNSLYGPSLQKSTTLTYFGKLLIKVSRKTMIDSLL